MISIHTPAKGVTGSTRVLADNSTNISIHTPAKGVTPYVYKNRGLT